MSDKRRKLSHESERSEAKSGNRMEFLQTITLMLNDEHVPDNVKDDLVRRLIKKDNSSNDKSG